MRAALIGMCSFFSSALFDTPSPTLYLHCSSDELNNLISSVPYRTVYGPPNFDLVSSGTLPYITQDLAK